jgi:hypothetical protein
LSPDTSRHRSRCRRGSRQTEWVFEHRTLPF